MLFLVIVMFWFGRFASVKRLARKIGTKMTSNMWSGKLSTPENREITGTHISRVSQFCNCVNPLTPTVVIWVQL